MQLILPPVLQLSALCTYTFKHTKVMFYWYLGSLMLPYGLIIQYRFTVDAKVYKLAFQGDHLCTPRHGILI